MVITDPKQIMSIIIEEMEKQIRAYGVKRGLSSKEIEEDVKNNYKKLPRIAAVITKRIISG
jgi:hypothetical protein